MKEIIKIKLVAIIKAIFCAFIPIVSCVLLMHAMGRSWDEVYLPNATQTIYNDELTYYQLVNSSLSQSSVIGYFGYNESHSEIGNNYAWSPARTLCWCILGKIFGWNYNSPWIYNIVMIAISMFLFSMMTNPSRYTIVRLFLGFSPLFLFSKGMLSGMSEASTFAFLIVFMGLIIRWYNNKNINIFELIFACVIVLLLFLMRPYYVICLVIVCILTAEYRNKKTAFIIAVPSVPVYVYLYELFNKKMVAPINGAYVEPNITGNEKGALASIVGLFDNILQKSCQVLYSARYVFESNDIDVYYTYAINVTVWLILLLECVYLLYRYNHKSDKEKYLLIGCVSSLLIFIMCVYTCSYLNLMRHITGSVIIMMIIICNHDINERNWICIVNSLLFAMFSSVVILNYDNIVPRIDIDKEKQLCEISSVMNHANSISGDDSWDYTIDWVLRDSVEEGDIVFTDFTFLYAMPSNMGINPCDKDYIVQNFTNLKSKYIYTMSGGEVAKLCSNNGDICIYDNGIVSIYSLR